MLGRMWRIRKEMRAYWRDTLETKPIEIQYENLVSNQEHETRRLIKYLDLPWNNDCLQFHKSKRIAATISYDQVNKKMYTTSKGRWANYEKYLGPVIEHVKDYL